ncbi:MAG TPA: transposase [Gemmatimonadales bacterium]|nr:transposase [Gemmatimonadales bacterium]
MAFKRYTDEEREAILAILEVNGGDTETTAAQTGVHQNTLIRWRDDLTKLGDKKKAALADRLEELAHILVDAIPNKVAFAPLQQVATTLGIVTEKMLLLRGEPTSIEHHSSEDARERIARRLIELGAGEDQEPAPEQLERGRRDGAGV